MGCEVREKHRLPWRPAARADLGLAALVHGVSLGPGDAHVRVAVQESQDREGHPRPACRGRTDGRAVRKARSGTSHGCKPSPLGRALVYALRYTQPLGKFALTGTLAR